MTTFIEHKYYVFAPALVYETYTARLAPSITLFWINGVK